MFYHVLWFLRIILIVCDKCDRKLKCYLGNGHNKHFQYHNSNQISLYDIESVSLLRWIKNVKLFLLIITFINPVFKLQKHVNYPQINLQDYLVILVGLSVWESKGAKWSGLYAWGQGPRMIRRPPLKKPKWPKRRGQVFHWSHKRVLFSIPSSETVVMPN